MFNGVATEKNVRVWVGNSEAPYSTDHNVSHPHVDTCLQPLPDAAVTTVLGKAEDEDVTSLFVVTV